MKRLWKWLNWHPTGIYVQFGLALALVVGGIFTYFSMTGCTACGYDPGRLPPTTSPVSTHSSTFTFSANIIKPDMEPNITNTGSLYPTFGSLAEHQLSWTGNQPERLVYTPPPGSTNVEFPDPNKRPQPGGPPYVFLNPPQDIPVKFNYPAAPAGTTYWKVAETLQSTNTTGTNSVTFETALSSTAALSRERGTVSRTATTTMHPNLGPPPPNSLMSRWYWVENVTMDAALCQQIVDWLQSSQTFVALQTPVQFPSGIAGAGYYQNPLLMVPDQAKLQLLTKSYPATDLINPIPLEYRPERMTFTANRLPPSVDGQRWVSVGLAQTPKVVCAADLNQAEWEFKISLPIDLTTGDIPLYFCQEGQNPPPIGQVIQKTLTRKSLANGTGTVQADGITCIGPQPHSLATTYTLKFGNPSIAWGIKTPKTINIFHELYVSSYPTTINFSMNSQINGANWELFWGDETAPDPSKKIGNSATLTTPTSPYFGVEFLWLVGTVPDGTPAGSHNVTITAVKADDANVKTSITDLLWVDVWVPPPLPGGLQYIHLPVILQKQ